MSAIAFWVETHCRILNFAAALPENRYKRVRAEDVLNDPQSQLRSITAWLGLPTDSAAMEAILHPEASPFVGFGPRSSGIIGGNDPNFLRDLAQRRVVAATVGILGSAPIDGDVAIIAHGGVGTLLLCHLSGLAISRDRDQPPTNGGNYFAFDQMTLRLIHGWRSITPLTQA